MATESAEYVAALFYADDGWLASTNARQLQESLDTLTAPSKQMEL
jgi:hypothetical protein